MTKAVFIIVHFSSVVLFARAVGHEAPPWAAQDRPYVAACIRYRMVGQGLSVEQVLRAPGQFSVVYLLDRDPPDMPALFSLAVDALMDDDPLPISHFYSPLYVDAPEWARDEWLVETPGTVQRFYLLPGWEGVE